MNSFTSKGLRIFVISQLGKKVAEFFLQVPNLFNVVTVNLLSHSFMRKRCLRLDVARNKNLQYKSSGKMSEVLYVLGDEEYKQDLDLDCIRRSPTLWSQIESEEDLIEQYNNSECPEEELERKLQVHMGTFEDTPEMRSVIDLILRLLCERQNIMSQPIRENQLEMESDAVVLEFLRLIDFLEIDSLISEERESSWLFSYILERFSLQEISDYFGTDMSGILQDAFLFEIFNNFSYGPEKLEEALDTFHYTDLPPKFSAMAKKHPWSFGYPEPDFYVKFGTRPETPQRGKIPFPDKLWKGLELHQSRNWRKLESLDVTLQMGLTPDFMKIVESDRAVGEGARAQRENSKLSETNAMKYLNMAIREGQLEIAEFLRNQDPRREKKIDLNAILEAGAQGDLDMIRHFLYRVNINYQNPQGDSLLSLAIENKDVEMLRLLLSNRFLNVNLLNHYQKTPLMVAIDKGYLDIVELLLERPDIDIEYVNDNYESAYSLASSSEHIYRLLKMLDAVRKRQKTALPSRRRR